VFVVHNGTWAFRSGVTASDAEATLTAGDVISLPTDIFRGFENIGDDLAFLYAILGGDDPGRVLSAPQVFDLAREHGLVLMEDGSLVDTRAGEQLPQHLKPMPVTSPQQIAQHRVLDNAALAKVIIKRATFRWSGETALARFEGVEEAALLGPANAAERLADGHLSWSHGFVLRALKLRPTALVPAHIRREEEVIFLHQGRCLVTVDGEQLELQAGDTFTTPIGARRSFANAAEGICVMYITRRTDAPQAPEFI
jgi:quercetin dioxygenase-like cupin family protein